MQTFLGCFFSFKSTKYCAYLNVHATGNYFIIGIFITTTIGKYYVGSFPVYFLVLDKFIKNDQK